MFGSRRFNVRRVAARQFGRKPIVRMNLACGAMAVWAAAEGVGQDQDRSADVGGFAAVLRSFPSRLKKVPAS